MTQNMKFLSHIKGSFTALISIVLVGCSSGKKIPQARYGNFEMDINSINQLHTLNIQEDFTWHHRVTDYSNGNQFLEYLESGKYTFSKSKAGFIVIKLDDFSLGYDLMSSRDKARKIDFKKNRGNEMYFDYDNSGEARLVSDSEYGHFYVWTGSVKE